MMSAATASGKCSSKAAARSPSFLSPLRLAKVRHMRYFPVSLASSAA